MITVNEHVQMALYLRRCANSWAAMARLAGRMNDFREHGYRQNAEAFRRQARAALREARAARAPA